MKSNSFYKFCFLVLFVFSAATPFIGQAQDSSVPENLNETLLELDANFWKAYNTCNLEEFKTYLTQDLEFYHDKGGLTLGLSNMLESVKNGLCGNNNSRLRREPVEETVQIYPLANYGAIMTGEHVFYLTENGNKERLIEAAKFTHVWQNKDGQWKMSRVLSYDHRPISENSAKEVKAVPREILEGFAGNYSAPNTGAVTIVLNDDNTLKMDAGQMKAQLHAETETLFFIKEAPITLEFVQDFDRKTVKFIVRESGNIVEEAVGQKN